MYSLDVFIGQRPPESVHREQGCNYSLKAGPMHHLNTSSIQSVNNRVAHLHAIQLREPRQRGPVVSEEWSETHNCLSGHHFPPQDHRPLLRNLVDRITLAEPHVVVREVAGRVRVFEPHELGATTCPDLMRGVWNVVLCVASKKWIS
jgi:hypothetical protein